SIVYTDFDNPGTLSKLDDIVHATQYGDATLIHQSKGSDIWTGSFTGISRFRDKPPRFLSIADDTLNESAYTNIHVTALLDTGESLLVGAANGLKIFKKTPDGPLQAESALHDNFLRSQTFLGGTAV